MADSHEMMQKALPGEKILNTDESGHYENARRFWTWAFRASGFTFFKIEPSRGLQVLLALLGREFSGIVGCDYYSAYRKYGKDCGVLLQFGLAHFIRDVKFLTTLSEPMAVAYGRRLLEGLRDLFHVIHQRKIMEFRRAGIPTSPGTGTRCSDNRRLGRSATQTFGEHGGPIPEKCGGLLSVRHHTGP